MTTLTDRSLALNKSRPAAKRRWSGAQYLALIGVPILAIQAWTLTAWLADGPSQVTESRDTSSVSWYAAHAFEALAALVAIVVIRHLYRDCKRQGRFLTFDVMFCMAGATLWWADESLNFWTPNFLPSSNFVNLTNPCGHIPFVVNPDCGAVPDAILFFFLVETFAVLGAAIVAEKGLRRLQARRPDLSRAQIVLIILGVGLTIDVIWESASVALGLWSYTLWPAIHLGSGLRFAFVEALGGALWFAAFIMLRYFKDDRGRTYVERGLDNYSPGVRRGVTLLALYALAQMIMWVGGNFPQALASFYQKQWPEDMPAHIHNNICEIPGGADDSRTGYGPCPGSPGFRMPGRDTR